MSVAPSTFPCVQVKLEEADVTLTGTGDQRLNELGKFSSSESTFNERETLFPYSVRSKPTESGAPWFDGDRILGVVKFRDGISGYKDHSDVMCSVPFQGQNTSNS